MADCCDFVLEYDENEPVLVDVTDYIPQPIIGFEQSDWEETDESSGAYIKNKPNITSVEPATSAPLMDGTATVGTSTKYAREDHVHPTDQSLVSGLTNISQGLAGVAQRVTTAENKLAGIEAGAEVNVQADWNQTTTTADDYIKNKPTIPTVPITSISLNGQAITVDGNKNANIVLTAGDGISITNGVISVNYPNGDTQSF